jgi:phage terminase small subunit
MTPKQELFAQAYLETSNASEAYKRAYNTQANANTVNRKASQLLKHPEVIKLLADLQAIHRQRHKLTIDDILQELEQSRLLALENIQCSAAISATMGKAKLLGLDKQVIEHKGILTPVFNFQPVKPAADLTEEEQSAELAKYGIDSKANIKQAMKELQEEY